VFVLPKTSSHQPSPTTSGPSAGGHNPGFGAVNSLLGLSNDDYLHKLPEKDVFIQLIDCFRMRMEDEYTFKGDNYGCERLAYNKSGLNEWADIHSAVEKSDIIEHYGDGMMPMKLRVLGEKIYGKGFM